MSSRNEATILPYKTTLDPYSTNGMHQINSPLSHSNSMKFNQRCQNSYQCNDYNQYDDNNNRLDNILKLKGFVNITYSYGNKGVVEVLDLIDAVSLVPLSDRIPGFCGTFLSSDVA